MASKKRRPSTPKADAGESENGQPPKKHLGFPMASPDDPIFKRGYVIGGRRIGTASPKPTSSSSATERLTPSEPEALPELANEAGTFPKDLRFLAEATITALSIPIADLPEHITESASEATLRTFLKNAIPVLQASRHSFLADQIKAALAALPDPR